MRSPSDLACKAIGKAVTEDNGIHRRKLYSGLVVEYALLREGYGQYLCITDPTRDKEIMVVNSSDLYALRDILNKLVPRRKQFGLWLWRKITFRNWRAERRLRWYCSAAKGACSVLPKEELNGREKGGRTSSQTKTHSKC